MGNRHRWLATAIASVVITCLLAACGGSSNKGDSGGGGGQANGSSSGGSKWMSFVYNRAPDSLDPQFGYTTYADEVIWLTNTGLLTYTHKSGVAGTQIIPGLASGLPKVTDSGKTYTLFLRKGLVFSNGKPVKASDFTYTVERAIKLPWGGSGSFVDSVILGAEAYEKGKSKTISGITADDKTGKITIRLVKAYGAFDNVLALTGLGIVPSGTPFQNEPIKTPPGVGPYEVQDVKPNTSFNLVKNPHWASMHIPGIPAGHTNIHVQINTNIGANVLSILNGSADILDWSDQIPSALMPQITAKSKNFTKESVPTTYYLFMNSKTKPFSSQLAREAVVTGISETAMNRIGGGTLRPGCFYLPPAAVGHSDGPCPYGNPASGGNLAKAKALVKQSGMQGQSVTVWSQTGQPIQQWMTYYTQFLNQIGFKATIKIISDATYWQTIGNVRLNAQTGFGEWNPDFPNPIDYYTILNGNSITPTNNENFGRVDDPHIQAELGQLGLVPSAKLSTVASRWTALDAYVARKAYVAVFGYPTFPGLVSDKVNASALVFQPVYGWDWTSFETN